MTITSAHKGTPNSNFDPGRVSKRDFYHVHCQASRLSKYVCVLSSTTITTMAYHMVQEMLKLCTDQSQVCSYRRPRFFLGGVYSTYCLARYWVFSLTRCSLQVRISSVYFTWCHNRARRYME